MYEVRTCNISVANKHPFYLEKMDVSLPRLAQLEDTRKLQKLTKTFAKKHSGLMELLNNRAEGNNHNVVVDQKAMATLNKFIKDVSYVGL